MRKSIMMIMMATILAISFSSCRDTKTREEVLVEDMQDQGADIKVKETNDGHKIKMETEDKKVKIKKDGDKIKIKEKDKD